MRAFNWASYSCFLRASSALTKLWGGREGGRERRWLGVDRIEKSRWAEEIRLGGCACKGLWVEGWGEERREALIGVRIEVSQWQGARAPAFPSPLNKPCKRNQLVETHQKDMRMNPTTQARIFPLSKNKSKIRTRLDHQGRRAGLLAAAYCDAWLLRHLRWWSRTRMAAKKTRWCYPSRRSTRQRTRPGRVGGEA